MSKGIIPQLDELLNLRHLAKKIHLFNNMARVSNLQSGSRISNHKGRGVDFDEVRPYQPGDDPRMIHWSLTARLGKPFTKIYKEEREPSVYLLLDQSTSMSFGTKVCFKNVLAANIAATIGWTALDQHEQVGGIIFNDSNAQLFKPKRSKQNFLNLLKTLSDNTLQNKHFASFNDSLKQLSQKIPFGSTVVLVSDFNFFDENTKVLFNLINQRAKIINILVYDPLEKMLPTNGSYTFTNTGREILKINASNSNRDKYQAEFDKKINSIAEYSQKNHMQFFTVATNDNIVDKINYGAIGYGRK